MMLSRSIATETRVTNEEKIVPKERKQNFKRNMQFLDKVEGKEGIAGLPWCHGQFDLQ